MFIQTQDTPNPATMKFLPGQTVMSQGTADFRSSELATKSPLAQRLFSLQGVSGIFLGADFISVTKSDDTDWSMLKPMILTTLMEHLSTDQPIMLVEDQGGNNANDENEDDDEIILQIKE